jgi:hypothetical protein
LSATAKTQSWKQVNEPEMGTEFQGADVAFWNMIGMANLKWILMVYQREKDGNTFAIV